MPVAVDSFHWLECSAVSLNQSIRMMDDVQRRSANRGHGSIRMVSMVRSHRTHHKWPDCIRVPMWRAS